MRAFAFVAVLLLAATACEGAALLRFINTVPTRVSTIAANTLSADFARVLDANGNIDRVGIQYFADAVTTTSATSTPTLLWTEIVHPGTGAVADTWEFSTSQNTYGYAWSHAMPPLRAYHTSAAAANTMAIDTLADVGWAETVYTPSTLKADGISGYMSIAAGTYRMQAYAVMGNIATTFPIAASSASGNPIRPLTASSSQFTFQDNRVYTLVAIGDGRYSVTPTPMVGNDISLRLFEESTAPTTFGKAAVRWFHAIRAAKTDTINVFLGDSSSAAPLAKAVTYGGLSDYVDVSPNTQQVFAVTTTSGGANVIAPTSAGKLEVTHDIRAGSRVTIICSTNNDVDNLVFCRQIPSRVVAYVRLINDLAGSANLHLGNLGSTPLNRVNLTLWASYYFPRPDQTTELSQTGGVSSATNHPGLFRGLYGVVSNVGPSTVSGYGEVYVPISIMDFALRAVIVRDIGTELNAVSGDTLPVVAGNVLPNHVYSANYDWFNGAPIGKRVHFVVRTAGGATISGGNNNAAGLNGAGTTLWRIHQTAPLWHENSVLVDSYIEPGASYSLFATPRDFLTPAVVPATVVNIPAPSEVRFWWRQDLSVATASSSAAASGKGTVTVIANHEQVFGASTFNLRPKTVRRASATQSVAASTSGTTLASNVATVRANFIGASTAGASFTANTGDYTIDHTLAAATAQSCYNMIPGTTDLSVNTGDLVTVMALNSFGCFSASNDFNQVKVVAAKSQSAAETGNADGTLISQISTPAPAPTFFPAAAPSLSVSMFMVIASIFAAVAALL